MRASLTKALILLSLAGANFVGAVEIEAGKVKINLNEKTGRFNLYVHRGETAEADLAFLSDRNPANTVRTLLVDDKTLDVERNETFEQWFEETPLGARFIWTSTRLVVTETYSIISGGVKMSLTVKNISDRSLSLGVGYLFDTNSEEKTGAHFALNDKTPLTEETVVAGDSPLQSWTLLRSAAEGQSSVFKMRAGTAGATKPDRIVFANWGSVYGRLWDFMKIEGRDVTRRPAPLLDSTVCQYYYPEPLKPNAQREVTLVIEIPPPEGTTPILARDQGGSSRDDAPRENLKPRETDINYAAAMQKVSILNNILEVINQRMSDGDLFSALDSEMINLLLEAIGLMGEEKYGEMEAGMVVINNLLNAMNEMIKSGQYSQAEVDRLNNLILLLEKK